VIYRVLATVGIAVPYLEFAKDHCRIPMSAAAFSCVGLAAIIVFIEKKKIILPLTQAEVEKDGAKMAMFTFCTILFTHAVLLS
jgi:hypothetical protein